MMVSDNLGANLTKGAGEELRAYRASVSKEYLAHVSQLRARVQGLQAETNALRVQMEGISTLDISLPSAPSVYTDGIPDAVIKLQEMIGTYCAELFAYLDEEQEAHNALSRMPDANKSQLLKLHYLAGWTWVEVATHLGYSYEYVMKCQVKALDMLYDYLPHTARPPRQEAI